MYSSKSIERAQSKVERATKLTLKRYSIDDVQQRKADLLRLIRSDGTFTRDFTMDEKSFMRNEQLLVMIDFRYWLQRYASLLVDQGGLGTFSDPWESQEILLKHISRIEDEMIEHADRGESVDGILIFLHKARQLGACLVAGTRVLTADLRWVPIEYIHPGDLIASVDEEPPGGKGIARKMRKATVLNCVSMDAPTWRIALDDGTVFQSTFHHKFLFKQHGGHTAQWREAKDARVGDEIRRVVSPWLDDRNYNDGWFGGFLDGEGSLRRKTSGGAELCGAQVPGPVLDRAISYLRDHNYIFRFDIDTRKGEDTSKFGDKEVHKVVVSQMHDIFRLLGTTRPSRFINRDWWVGKELPNNDGRTWAKVVDSQMSLVRHVYDIETTTRTYVAEGFVSHNTAIARAISVHSMTAREHTRAMAASVDDDKVLELYDRDKLIIDNLPFYLRPSIGFDEKAQHIFFDKLGSRVIYQLGTQKSGLGQGRQFDVTHLTECASWPYPGIIEHDWMPTIPQSLRAFALLESTAQGRGNWWHQSIKKLQDHKLRRWNLVFIPWYAEIKKYRATPPLDWTPSDEAMKHAQRVHETSHAYVGRAVMLTREQLYWWQSTRDEYYLGNNLAVFYTNYCATIEESFQHRVKSAFSYETLEHFRARVANGTSYHMEVTSASS